MEQKKKRNYIREKPETMYNSIYVYGLVAMLITLVVANIILWWLIRHTKGCNHSHNTPFVWRGITLYKCERCGAILDQKGKVYKIGEDI